MKGLVMYPTRFHIPSKSYRYPYSDKQKKEIKDRVLSMQKRGMDIWSIAIIMQTNDKGVRRILSWEV